MNIPYIEQLARENQFKYFLPIFRVYIAFHFFKKIFLHWNVTSLTYGNFYKILPETSPLTAQLFDIPVLLLISIISSILLMFGIGKKITPVIFCLCVFFNTQITGLYANGGDNLLMYVAFYLIFTNSYEYLCWSPEHKEHSEASNLISNLAALCIPIHLCLIYFVSFVHKIHADPWFNGVANYYILNLEIFCGPFNYLFSKNTFFIAFSTYFTLAFELLFPLFVWYKRWRNTLLISGIILHLGIYITMMIYDFEILFIMIYGFFLTNKEWADIISRLTIGAKAVKNSLGFLKSRIHQLRNSN